jgi:predicted dehydrogenase
VIGIGLVGYGHWGPNLARNLAAAGARIVAVSDQREDRLALAQTHYPGIAAAARWNELVAHQGVDAVVVATPPATHFEIAGNSLASGKHVLVEKPLTTDSDQACRLIDCATRRGLTLMVDHTFIYSSSVQAIRRIVADGTLGDFHCYDGIRLSPRPACDHVNVVWDLAAHDLAIIDYIVERRPTGVAAIGLANPIDSPVDDASVTLTFGAGLISHVHVSWLSAVKIRRTLIGGSRRTIVYDDMEPGEKVKVHDFDPQRRIGGKAGEMWAPRLDAGEPLAAVAREFLDCIATARRPLADGEAGLRVVQALEVAGTSLQQGGRMLRLPDGAPM